MNIQLIMERIREGSTPDCFKLWACRGEGKGCTRNTYRSRKVHCDDCVETNEEETLKELSDRLERKG